jgi:hypothetical protein
MDELLKKLNEDQAQVALDIARKAKEMGIDPKLAVALAFRESGLNPNTKNGTSGEIGLMQVMPKTAEMMGFTVEDLKDPNKNITIGLTYLKQGLDKFGDPVLAAAGYNAGHNHPYFTDPDKNALPESTKGYLKDIGGLGGFAPSESKPEAVPEPVPTPASESDFMANKARIAAGAMGMGAGAALSKGLDVAQNVGDTAAAIRQIPGALAAAQAPSPTAPSAPAGGPMARPVAGGPAGPVGGPVAPLQQMGGAGAYNYGKAFGLTDIEAGRALDMTKQAGGVHDLTTQRREGLGRVQQLFPNQFVENPRFGGIMTPQQGGGGVPRANYVQGPSGLTQIPVAAPVSAALPPPTPPSALSQAAGVAKRGAGAVLNSPITMGGLGGLSAAMAAQEADARLRQGDTTGATIAAAGGIGGAMQMMPNPKIRAIGAVVSAASPLTQYLRDKLRSVPDDAEIPLTPEEILQTQTPSFRYARP